MNSQHILTALFIYICVFMALMYLSNLLIRNWTKRFNPVKATRQLVVFIALNIFLMLLFYAAFKNKFFTFFLVLTNISEVHALWRMKAVLLKVKTESSDRS